MSIVVDELLANGASRHSVKGVVPPNTGSAFTLQF
jgi:hypothetical protein